MSGKKYVARDSSRLKFQNCLGYMFDEGTGVMLFLPQALILFSGERKEEFFF